MIKREAKRARGSKGRKETRNLIGLIKRGRPDSEMRKK